MGTTSAAVLGAAAVLSFVGLTGCASSAASADMQAGDCLELGGTFDQPEATRAECGSKKSNYKVVQTVADSARCPADVDSYYTLSSRFGGETHTVCMDIDWVVGGCMNVDPENNTDPYRVDCSDAGAPHRQRVTEVLEGISNPDQCATGLGYAYDERQFTVCVENVR
ncbi:LppU family putative lipoprotein [Mycolicibacterium smegmatis]|uniref:Lipoprotein LppU n=3 Tax=Mycolicibacterium smegmatis TaxID=1772 RepID=I7FBZ7_MYCS2|nr:Lipoprotein LppU [Mycolicibacterium smegmatis MC2 155]